MTTSIPTSSRHSADCEGSGSEADPSLGARLIDIGLVIAGAVDEPGLAAIREMRQCTLARLREWFPDFEWRIELLQRAELAGGSRVEPALVLQQGVQHRHDREWDFVVVVTAADLVSHYKPFALAAVSRSLDAAVISMARFVSPALDRSDGQTQGAGLISAQLSVIMLHVLGHLAGLGHSEDPENLMNDIDSLDEVHAMSRLNDEQRTMMSRTLGEIADLRLEERDAAELRKPLQFFVRSAWLNRHEIADAVHQAHPWEFPVRLSRLTTAAVSAVILLLLTAETWELAMNQPLWRVVILFSASLFATTIYVVQRQQLLIRRNRRQLTEQIVITNAAAFLIVITGMFTTFLCLFLISFAAVALYPGNVVSAWAATVPSPIGMSHYCLLTAFVSSIGILVGSLGASFEEQHHFRHITFVDEET